MIMNENFTQEDCMVYFLVMLVLTSFYSKSGGLIPITEFSVEDIQVEGDHKIYTFKALVRDDYPIPNLMFQEKLERHAVNTRVKPKLHSIEDFPLPNFYHAVFYKVID